MCMQIRSSLLHTEGNQSTNVLQPLMVSLVILNIYKSMLLILIRVVVLFLFSAGESCSEPSDTQQIQETACAFIPLVSDQSHEVKSITATLTKICNVSTVTAKRNTEREGKRCSYQTLSTFMTLLLSTYLCHC